MSREPFTKILEPGGGTETDTGTVATGTELLLKHSGELTQSNRDAVKIPLGGAAIRGVNVGGSGFRVATSRVADIRDFVPVSSVTRT